MTTQNSRKETERTKLIQEKCQTLLTQMLRDEDNKYCVDCDAKGPRWASWNLGVFLCIRCAGIHRNLGVHISRVKSVNLDTWTPEQVISLQQMGNSRARAVYEAQLPDGFRRPQTDTALESFIRAKYEHKKYLAREWVPPSPPKVDWGKEIDDELEKQKRKKKAAQASSALGIGVMGVSSDKKSTHTNAKSSPLPAPLPKPKPGQSGSSPKTQRASTSATSGDPNHSNDLLGLSSPTKPIQSYSTGGVGLTNAAQDLNNDSFSGFLSAAPAQHTDAKPADTVQGINNPHNNFSQNSLAKEEEDFFNQGTLVGNSDKDKSGKMTKDSILALYGAMPSNANASNNTIANNPHNPQMNFGQPQPPMFGATGAGFTGMSPGYMSAAGGAPHLQHPQFMTPPNSASMYNAPVMTAPNAFTTPGMGATASYGMQYPMSNSASIGYPHQMSGLSVGGGGGVGGVGSMATGQGPQTAVANGNLMFTNHSLLRGAPMNSHTQIGSSMMPMSTMSTAAFQAPSSAAATANLNQQFGNLNIGNVWQ